jgi:hypothetical protein
LDLSQKLQRVLRDGSLVQSYRNRAQVRVQKEYDWEHVVDQYEELFASMAGHTAGGSSVQLDSDEKEIAKTVAQT